MEASEETSTVKSKGKFYKKWSFWAIVIVVVIIAAASSKNPSAQTATNTQQENSVTNNNSTQQTKADKPSVSAEYVSALAQAADYANTMHLSKQGVYDQLVSEYGGKFKADAAQYAIDNVSADWNANALSQAKTYQNDMHLSTAAVRDQLVSQYGGKFTESEADYAIQHLGD